MKTIPENNATKEWDKVRIGDALRLINGRAFKPSEWKERGLPIVRIQNLNNAEAPFNYYEGDLPEKFLLNNGDLLFAWSGTPGTSFGAHIWRGGKAWLNQHIFKVLFDEADFNKKFLQFAINQNLNEYIRAAHGGAGLAHITKGRFEQSELLKPTLDEQRQIVAEIEKQFSRLDEAVANLKRVKANLKRYKAAVLKAAVEGKLTEDWRKQHPNVEPAGKLLERILSVRREKWKGKGAYKEPIVTDPSNLSPLPGGWTWASVDQCAEVFLGKMLDKEKHRTGRQLPYLRNINVRWGRIDTDDLLEMFFKDTELERYGLLPGDVLVCEGGEPGRAAVWDGRIPELKYQKALHRVRFYGRTEPRYLVFLLEFLANAGRLERLFTGSTIKHLTRESFVSMPIPLPPVHEQKEIVAEVERRLSVIEELEAAVEANLTRADRLRQSILQQAFSGQLVPEASNSKPAPVLNAPDLSASVQIEPIDTPTDLRSSIQEVKSKMANLIEALSSASDWISAQEAFRLCGAGAGAETDAIERIYEELRDHIDSGRVMVNRRGESDWLRLSDRRGA